MITFAIANAKRWQRTYYAVSYKEYSRKGFQTFFMRDKRIRILCMPYNNHIEAICIYQSYSRLSYNYRHWEVLKRINLKNKSMIVSNDDTPMLKFKLQVNYTCAKNIL